MEPSKTVYKVEYTYGENPNENVMYLMSPEAAIAEVRDRRRRGQSVRLWVERENMECLLADVNEVL